MANDSDLRETAAPFPALLWQLVPKSEIYCLTKINQEMVLREGKELERLKATLLY